MILNAPGRGGCNMRKELEKFKKETVVKVWRIRTHKGKGKTHVF